MTVQIDGEVEGLRGLQKAIASLDDVSKQGRVMRLALRRAAKPHVDTAKSTLASNSYDTGALEDGTTLSVVSGRKAKVYNHAAFAAGIRFRSNKRRGGWRWHWIEYGTTERKWGNGKSTGKIKAEPFVRPAFRKHKSQMVRTLATEMRKLVNNAVKRQLRQARSQ